MLFFLSGHLVHLTHLQVLLILAKYTNLFSLTRLTKEKTAFQSYLISTHVVSVCENSVSSNRALDKCKLRYVS